MDNIKSLNDALDYIDSHLMDDIDMTRVNQIAGCSSYHFQRMFSYLAQMTLHEYIKRRRLSLASLDCIQTDERIIDLAIKYGYQTHDSFTRAFTQFHGVTPSQMRKNKAPLNMFPKLSFQLIVKGNSMINSKIVEKGAFNLIGLSKRVPIIFNGVNQDIIELVSQLNVERIKELKLINDCEPKGIISASYNFSENRMNAEGSCEHLIGVHTTKDKLEGYHVLSVAAHTWVVFDVIGKYPDELQNTWAKIYSEWLPSSNYECVDGPEIVWNEGPELTKENYHSEIWIPVRKIKKN